jgi:hypothetical protein
MARKRFYTNGDFSIAQIAPGQYFRDGIGTIYRKLADGRGEVIKSARYISELYSVHGFPNAVSEKVTLLIERD